MSNANAVKTGKKKVGNKKKTSPRKDPTSTSRSEDGQNLLDHSDSEAMPVQASSDDVQLVAALPEETSPPLPASEDLAPPADQQTMHDTTADNPAQVPAPADPVEADAPQNPGDGGPAASSSSWTSWLAGAQEVLNEKLHTGFNQVIEQVEIGLRGIPPDESDNEDDAYTLNEAAQKQVDNAERGEDGGVAADVVISQENISKQEYPQEEERSTDFNELVNEAARDASKWGIDRFMNIKSKGMNMMTDGLEMLDTLGKQTLEQVSSAVCATDEAFNSFGDAGYDDNCDSATSSDKGRTLSATLRQAKRLAESRSKENQQLQEAQQANFSWLFDNYKGLLSLEALECLSQQSKLIVSDLEQGCNKEEIELINRVIPYFNEKQVDCIDQVKGEYTFTDETKEKFSQIHENIKIDCLLKVHEELCESIDKYTKQNECNEIALKDIKVIHKTSIKYLAKYCTAAIYLYNKIATLVLSSTFMDFQRMNILKLLNTILIKEVSAISEMFVTILGNIQHSSIEITTITSPISTDIAQEASNTGKYIDDAYNLLLPVFQHSLIKYKLEP